MAPRTLAEFRALLGDSRTSRALAHHAGEGFAFAAFDTGGERQSLVSIGEALIRYDLHKVEVSGAAFERADGGVDLEGVLVDDWAVFFHNEPFLARSGLSFAVEKPGEFRILVTGLAPGAWELWRNGWLDRPVVAVKPQHSTAFVRTAGGRFFLRKL